MANPEYSENKDRKYLTKGKHGIPRKVLFPKGSVPKINMKFPAIATQSGARLIKQK